MILLTFLVTLAVFVRNVRNQ